MHPDARRTIDRITALNIFFILKSFFVQIKPDDYTFVNVMEASTFVFPSFS